MAGGLTFKTLDPETGYEITLHICQRCGQAIKSVYWFRELCYGSECIRVVSGEKIDHWVMRGNVIDEEATKKRESARAEKLASQQSERAEREAARAKQAEANNPLICEMENCYQGGFISSIIADLRNGSNPIELPNRAKDIIIDAISKNYGRRNSKAYNAKCDEIAAYLWETETT